MAIITNTAEYLNRAVTETGDVAGGREDLSDVIYNISPTETPFMSNIGRSKATSVRHEWQTDALAAATTNAQDQGRDYSGTSTTFPIGSVTATLRASNVTQICAKSFIIAGTTEALLKAGRKSEVAYQMAKKGKELKRDIEYNMTGVKTSTVVAVSGTGGKSRSLEAWMYTNDGHQLVGTTGSTSSNATTGIVDGTQRNLTEDLVRTQISNIWTQGGDPEMILCGPVNKQNISSQFAGIATLYREANAGPATIVGASDMYVSDFGELKIVPSRFTRDRTISIISKDMWAVAYLRPFQKIKLAKTGDNEKALLLAEWTLESRQQAASGKVADLNTTIL